MKALCLFGGIGLASLGLRQAGFETTDVELNPIAYYMGIALASQYEGKHHHILDDVLNLSDDFINSFDVIWASPPCQTRSVAKTQGPATSEYSTDLLEWCLNLVNRFPNKIIWVENVLGQTKGSNDWGKKYNSHQFGVNQSRNRVIGGHYPEPTILREYKRLYEGICPTITATEFKGCASDKRRASRFYGRKLTVEECALHMGASDLDTDYLRSIKFGNYTDAQWRNEIYTCLGNGVPIEMARAFGEVAMKNLLTSVK